MNTKEILARISSIEKELSALKELVKAEEKAVVIKKVYIMPSVVKRFLPEPPKVIHVDLTTVSTPKKIKGKNKPTSSEEALGCKILCSLPKFSYRGTCRVLKLQMRYSDNYDPKNPDPSKFNYWRFSKDMKVIALDSEMKVLGTYKTNLYGFPKEVYSELIKRGILEPDKNLYRLPPKLITIDFDC